MKYKELNLRKIREDFGLDFAHFTYLPGMCSCCYTPLDFPLRYWHGGVKPANMDNVQYLLFKNADNGRGCVKATDNIEKPYIEWDFPMEKLAPICKALQEQLGNEYVVLIPPNSSLCIHVLPAWNEKERNYDIKKLDYTPVL